MSRVGIGWDAHAFGGPGPLKLGGVAIPCDKGLSGHSDADALVHAICDALLGAAGLGDLGAFFPDTNPEYKNIDSLVLLGRVRRMIIESWFDIINVDSVIVAQEPRVSPYFKEMKENIARVLEIEVERVCVKASSPEGMGAVGRAEGIVAHAVASLTES
ncbi:MAG: 2-C-methyl-D-erythritol 2,4-cyclodiphosphate synthase [bacterium]